MPPEKSTAVKSLPPCLKLLLGLAIVATLLLAGTFIYLSQDEPPPDVSQLERNYRDIPPEQNAYVLLTALGTKVPNPFSEMDYDASERLAAIEDGSAPWDESFVAQTLKANDSIWPELAQALAAPENQPPILDSFSDTIPEVGQMRRLTRIACLRARQLSKAGNQEEAVRLLSLILILGQRMEQSHGSLINWLTGSAIKRQACQTLVHIETDTPLSASEIALLISLLEQQRPEVEAQTDTFRAEYHLFSNEFTNFTTKPRQELFTSEDSEPLPVWHRLARILPLSLKPNKTRRIYADYLGDVINRADTDIKTIGTLRLSAQFSDQVRSNLNPENLFGRMFLSIVVPTYDGIVRQRFLEQSLISATQALLAVRAYQNDHDGALPPTLEALVPNYLPSVPLDYYDRKPIRYSPEFRAIWSLGKEGDYNVTSLDLEPEEREIDLRLP